MIVVTGGAGFIGSVLIHTLNKMGREDIIVVDHFRDGEKWQNLRGLKYDRFVTPENFIENLFDDDYDISEIYHMGACSATTEKDMDFLYRNNIEFSQVLFNYATQMKVDICYASSAATYGSGEHGYDDQSDYSKLRPLNKYGYSKQFFDEWVLRQDAQPKRWYGVKFFNVYGPNEYHKGRMSSVVYQGYNQIKDNGLVKLFKSYKDGFEDGEQLRDFVYVKDVVKAMIMLMNEKHGGENGLYNLGTGKARSFYDLVKSTYQALELEAKVEFIEMPTDLRGQYQYFTEAKMEKLHKALPSFKFHSLEDGITDYIKNHLEKEQQNLDSNI